jgi:thiol-disulfide isomerase/thioredoxin
MGTRRPGPRTLAALLLPAAFFLLTACGSGDGERGTSTGVDAHEDPFPWRSDSFAGALEEAARTDRPLLVDVYASWCPPCRTLDKEIWETSEGRALAGGHLSVKVDFDTDEGQEVKRRYRVLGLPTVLFLHPDGAEVDRIEGYPGRDEFLAEARRYATGGSRLQEAQRALADDPGSPEARLRLGHLLLVRGEADGVKLLEAAAGGSSREAAGESLFLLGRYYSRATDEPARAIPYWARLHREFRDTSWAGGALYWLLKSYDEAGRMEDGLQAVRVPTVLQSAADFEQVVAYLAETDRVEEADTFVRTGLERFPESEGLKEYVEGD